MLKLVVVWFPSFLQAVGSQSIRVGTHVNRYLNVKFGLAVSKLSYEIMIFYLGP